ncbi:hypothetical protein [Haloarcula sp. Atlit-120R]|uniref:vWA domain-containing protein n=1 Tax=Haloarcula sp. Atlit-120R TaxID=2282135 RepID=UPI000EF206C7|nr:hypothetical protein [Haloarcula sp. Atlit-120R]RLM32885.1 hypothetical protein DVK01_19550 [Haloarcula sp. Atlit-120R]
MSEHDLESVNSTIAKQPIVFVLDTSNLTKRQISALNEGLELFHDEMEYLVDEHISFEGVEIAVVTYGGDVTVEQEFTPIEQWIPPTLSRERYSPMGEAIIETCRMVEDRKEEYQANGLPYRKPEIWLLANSSPTDMNKGDKRWSQVETVLETGINNDAFRFIQAGVTGADLETLSQLSPETDIPPLKVKEQENMFRDYFEFVAESPRSFTSVAAYISVTDIIEDSAALTLVD